MGGQSGSGGMMYLPDHACFAGSYTTSEGEIDHINGNIPREFPHFPVRWRWFFPGKTMSAEPGAIHLTFANSDKRYA